jgi:uncharacterized protein (TIGR04552 family)
MRVLSYQNSMPWKNKNTLIPVRELRRVARVGSQADTAHYLSLLEKGVAGFSAPTRENPHSLNYRGINITAREQVQVVRPGRKGMEELVEEMESEVSSLESGLARLRGAESRRMEGDSGPEELAVNAARFARITREIRRHVQRMPETIRFYFPYEIQIMDTASYTKNMNTEHLYRRNKRRTAAERVLRELEIPTTIAC